MPPDELVFLRVPFCKCHIRFLLLVYEVLEDSGLRGEDREKIIVLEAQALVYPVQGIPRLYLVQGARA